MILEAKPLTAEAFRNFGFVFEAPVTLGRSPPVAELHNGREQAAATLTLSLEEPTAFPVQVARLERHPFSTQTFIPLDLSRYLLIVASAGEDRKPTEPQAFIGTRQQGCSYRSGLWHAAFTVLDRRGSYAALVWRDGTENDEVFFDLARPLTVSGV
jgi:ureidoglycolate lyase